MKTHKISSHNQFMLQNMTIDHESTINTFEYLYQGHNKDGLVTEPCNKHAEEKSQSYSSKKLDIANSNKIIDLLVLEVFVYKSKNHPFLWCKITRLSRSLNQEYKNKICQST